MSCQSFGFLFLILEILKLLFKHLIVVAIRWWAAECSSGPAASFHTASPAL